MYLREIYKDIPYSKLTNQDIKILKNAGVFNGFGGAGQNPIIKFLIGKICRHFKEVNADKHDYGFWIGGDMKRFQECNTKFYFACQRDALRLQGFTKFKFLFIAMLAYIMIELFGKKYFYFHKK